MSSKPVIVFDIDGTLANAGHRLHYIQNVDGLKDWDAFYAACVRDTPIIQGVVIARLVYQTRAYAIEFWTGRRESVRQETRDWLVDHIGAWAADCPLRMRLDGDWRSQSDIKGGYIGDKNIFLAFDDWAPVVEMYRERGITVYQVAGAKGFTHA